MRRNLTICVLAMAWGATAFAIAGCGKKSTTKTAPPPPPVGTTETGINARVSQFNIYDERGSLTPAGRILHMPEITFVGQVDRVRPPLSDSDRSLLDIETRSFFVMRNDVSSMTVDVYIVEAMKRFEVADMKEIVVVDFQVRIELADDRNVHDVHAAEGTSKLTHEASDITREKIASMQKEAIQEAVRDAFGRIMAAM